MKHIQMHLARKSALGTLLLCISSITSAASCDVGAVRSNINWLKDNNVDAYNEIQRGCRILRNTTDSGIGLATIVDAYKNGQSHNHDASAAINGCQAADMLDLCDH